MDPDDAPRAARLSAWATAVIQGRCTPDDAVAAVVGRDAAHRVSDLPGRLHALPLEQLFDALPTLGVRAVRYAPAAPGDVSALPGPASFNARALGAGGAALAVAPRPFGLVADVHRHGQPQHAVVSVTWVRHDVSDRLLAPVDLRDAERQLAEVLQGALDALDRLDVARQRPQALDLTRAWSGSAPSCVLPPGANPRAARLLDRATHLAQVVALALEDDGAAVTAGESGQRTAVLRDLDRVLRHVAADAWNHGLGDGPDAARR